MASPTDAPNPTSIIGAITGVCALGLSIYNTIVQQLQQRTSLFVSLSYGLVMPGSTEMVILKFANHGKVNVNVVSCGLLLPGDKTVTIFPRELPKSVGSRDSAQEFTNLNELKFGMRRHGFSDTVKVFGYVNDALGRQYRSKKPLAIDLS